MPELPEVETTRRGIEPWLLGKRVHRLLVHEPRLRWPVPDAVQALSGALIHRVNRRGKYLLIGCADGDAIVHLGMSGSLRIANQSKPRRLHDHVEWYLDDDRVLRFHDPRRFGCLLWQARGQPEHSLLASLGPEPLEDDFTAEHLHAACRGRRVAIKNLIMNSSVVVGVGNIYASESLFMAGIRPGRAAKRLSRPDCERLVSCIKNILQHSIDQGGTTLHDFVNSDGNPGYFAQSLFVYGRAGEPCRQCGQTIRQRVIGQRSSFYCTVCQR